MSVIKLYCLPYAGGTAMIYNSWKKYLSHSIELVPIELSGRGKRLNTKLYDDIKEAVDDIYNSVKSDIGKYKYAFFGHSMGALLAHEVICKIKELDGINPVHAFFSGKLPPNMRDLDRTLHVLPDDEFLDEVIKLGGTEKEIFSDHKLKKIFLPILRSDFKLVENYSYIPRNYKFDFGITIFGGKADRAVKAEKLAGWQRFTNKNCYLYELEGDHFFIRNEVQKISSIINNTLCG